MQVAPPMTMHSPHHYEPEYPPMAAMPAGLPGRQQLQNSFYSKSSNQSTNATLHTVKHGLPPQAP